MKLQTAFAPVRNALRQKDARDTTRWSIEFERLLATPEQHDIQALPTAKFDGFGPVAGIVPWPGASSLTTDQLRKAKGPVGVLVAAAALMGDPGTEQMYTALGLTKEANYCLSVRGDPVADDSGKPEEWDAWIWTQDDGGCDATTPQNQKRLDAYFFTEGADDEDIDYPAAAWWDEGKWSKRDQTTFGVRCGTGWCEIGPDGFKPKRVDSNKAERPENDYDIPKKSRKTRVRGWYDEQWLAEVGTSLKPGSRAYIVPRDRIHDIPRSRYEAGYVELAKIRIFEGKLPLGKRYTDRGLIVGINTLSLTYDAGAKKWFAKIANKKTEYAGIKVTYQVHDWLPPERARWDWSDTDDDIWIACDAGCCHVELTGK
jgi:hypothetical protein